jgi:hypothetical protein
VGSVGLTIVVTWPSGRRHEPAKLACASFIGGSNPSVTSSKTRVVTLLLLLVVVEWKEEECATVAQLGERLILFWTITKQCVLCQLAAKASARNLVVYSTRGCRGRRPEENPQRSCKRTNARRLRLRPHRLEA